MTTKLHQTENINKAIEITKKHQREIWGLKSIITEIKNSLEAFKSRFELAGKNKKANVKIEQFRLCKLKNVREKRMKRNGQNLREMQNKCPNIHVTELPKEKNIKKREEKIFKEIAENVLNLLKSNNLHIQEALQTPKRINTKRTTNRYIILKMLKVKSNRKKP